MGKQRQLAKNTMIITMGKISTQFISFFLLPVYTSLLSTSDYGVVDLLNTYISLLVPIITLQVEQALFRFLIDVRNNDKEKTKYISSVLLFAIIQSFIYLFVVLSISRFINNNYKYFLATNVIACMFTSIMQQITRGLGDNKAYALSSFISATNTILLNILFIVVFRLGATGMLLATLISSIICIFFLLIKVKIYKYINIREFSKNNLKELLKYSLPLIPNALSWWTINVSDRTIISMFLTVAHNGIYAAANKFSGVFITFYNIFNLSWTESAALHINDSDRDEFFSNIIWTVYRIFLSICFGIISAMPFVFPVLINKKFGDSYYQIPILMIASLFNVVVGLTSVVYVAKKLTKEIAKTSVISAVINIGINIILIKYIGLYAASISTLVAYFSMMIYRCIDIRKYVKIRVDKRIIVSSIIMTIGILLAYYTNNLYTNILSFLVVVLYSIIVNKKIIGDIILFIRQKFLGKGEENRGLENE